jgi:lambda family phage portal protein
MKILDFLKRGFGPAPLRRMAHSSDSGPAPAGYDAASQRRPAAGFQRSPAHINSILAADAATLRDRSREQVRNNSYAKAAQRSWAANLVGIGVTTHFRHPEADLAAVLTETWKQWCPEADFDGITDYLGLQALIARAVFVSGEVFVRRRDMGRDSGMAVPMQLQLIDAAQVPLWKTGIAENGNEIRLGIEFDAAGKRAAYWVLKRHPGDWTQRLAAADSSMFVRVPAAEMIHVFEPQEPGQIRGEPRMSAALYDFWQLGEYDRAELTRKRAGTLFAGFVLEEDAENFATDGADDRGNADLEFEPGTLQVIKGKGVEFSTPPDVGGGYDPWQYRNLTRAAAGSGVPYMAMTGDLKGANYSSMRAGALEFRRQLEPFQQHTLIHQFCATVARWWFEAGILAGALPIRPAEWRQSRRAILAGLRFAPPRWDWVDPLKDIKGEQVAVDMGVRARSDVIEEMGEDPEEVDARRAADQERARRLGLPDPAPGDVGGQIDPRDETQDDREDGKSAEGDRAA